MASTTAGSKWTVQPVPGPLAALTVIRRTLWALGCPHLINVQCRPVLARKLLPHGPWRPWRPGQGLWRTTDGRDWRAL
jgi:hypothetical protein